MKQTLTIRLKPYLQEFLVCHLQQEICPASKKNIIGALLSPLVQYAPQTYSHKISKGSDYITFELPNLIGGKNTRNNTLILSDANQKEFERVLGVYFKSIFFNYVHDKIRYTGEIKKCILQFCSDYNISFNNLTYEMLKKAYYRKQQSSQKPPFFSINMSLVCPLIFLL